MQLRTTLNCGMTARQFQITSANVRVFGGYAMPSRGALFNYTLAENCAFVIIKNACLAGRLLHGRRGGL
jgi:hypothetical protein